MPSRAYVHVAGVVRMVALSAACVLLLYDTPFDFYKGNLAPLEVSLVLLFMSVFAVVLTANTVWHRFGPSSPLCFLRVAYAAWLSYLAVAAIALFLRSLLPNDVALSATGIVLVLVNLAIWMWRKKVIKRHDDFREP